MTQQLGLAEFLWLAEQASTTWRPPSLVAWREPLLVVRTVAGALSTSLPWLAGRRPMTTNGETVLPSTCKTSAVLVVRGTKKVLDRLDGATASDLDRSTTRLGDWYVNILFFRPQLALFVSEATLLPVLVPFAPAATLLERFPGALLSILQAHGVPRRFSDAELAEMMTLRLARAASRSVLGVMNEFRFLADACVRLDGESNPVALSLRLAMTPCGPLYKRHVSPDRELAALAAQHG